MPTLNIHLPDAVYRELVKAKMDAGCRSLPEFLGKVALGEIEIRVRILSVDGEPAEEHTVEFLLGDFKYHWTGYEFELVKEPLGEEVRATALRVM